MSVPMDARRYIALLTGDPNTPMTWQTFDDQKREKPDPLAKWFHGTLDQYGPKLAELNEQGAGIFIMVNEGDGRGRRKENVIRVRAVFVDFDNPNDNPLQKIENAPLKPNFFVESSPGRLHAYWIVKDCSLDQFSSVQKGLARYFKSDPAVHDLCRVMRVPGFKNCKRPEQYLVALTE